MAPNEQESSGQPDEECVEKHLADTTLFGLEYELDWCRGKAKGDAVLENGCFYVTVLIPKPPK